MLNPFALPIHPILVHFAIAMLSVAWICLVVRYATGDERWDARVRLFELVGVIALPATLVAAIIDTRGFRFAIHPRTDAPLIWHALAGLVAALAFGAHWLWRRRKTDPPAWQDLSLATFAMIALVAAGLIAGELVFGA